MPPANPTTTHYDIPLAKKSGGRPWMIAVLLVLAAALGVYVVSHSHAGGAATGTGVYSTVAIYYPASDATNAASAAIHTVPAECQQSRSVCHSNGTVVSCASSSGGVGAKLVPSAYAGGAGSGASPCGGGSGSGGVGAKLVPSAYAGGAGNAGTAIWESALAANNIPTNFTWFGPYATLAASGKGTGNNGYQACFTVEDIGPAGQKSQVYMDVAQNSLAGAQVVDASSQFSLNNQGFYNFMCLPFDIQSTSTTVADPLQYRGFASLTTYELKGVGAQLFYDTTTASMIAQINGTYYKFGSAYEGNSEIYHVSAITPPTHALVTPATGVQYRMRVVSGRAAIQSVTVQELSN